MNDFKIGDAIYCLEVADWSYKDEDIVANIYIGRVRSITKKYGLIAFDKFFNQINDSNRENFKSKNEAIDAMIKHLEGMKNDN